MKRSELTTQIMKDRKWEALNPDEFNLEDIVFNVKENEDWKYLRCVQSDGTYSEEEYGMCSTYRVYYKKEYFEVSPDKVTWFRLAERPIEVNRVCIYAD